MADALTIARPAARPQVTAQLARFARRNPTLLAGLLILAAMVVTAAAAPLIAGNPYAAGRAGRLEAPSAAFWFGTDRLGRDIFARTVYGTRVSLVVGVAVAVLSVLTGLVIGLLAGYFRWIEAVVMRVMDGLMAIPAILLALALVALNQRLRLNPIVLVILAITIPEIPRVVRLVRAVVLATREQPYVEAAIASGTPVVRILARHILPSTVPPLIVQATYICASAILIEAGLSFLGAGTPPDIPSWGNMISENRTYISLRPWTIFCPGLALALVVLAINLVGDGLRDRLDPRVSRRM